MASKTKSVKRKTSIESQNTYTYIKYLRLFDPFILRKLRPRKIIKISSVYRTSFEHDADYLSDPFINSFSQKLQIKLITLCQALSRNGRHRQQRTVLPRNFYFRRENQTISKQIRESSIMKPAIKIVIQDNVTEWCRCFFRGNCLQEFLKKVIFELNQLSQRTGHVKTWVKGIPVRGTATARPLEWHAHDRSVE